MSMVGAMLIKTAPACQPMQCHWSVIDPRDVMRLRGSASVETETVLAVFVYRLYSRLLVNWTALCAADHLFMGCKERELNGVHEITRDLCESPDPWEVSVGRKFQRYLVYFVDCVLERGLKRTEAEARRLAAVSIFWRYTDGQVDIDSFF